MYYVQAEREKLKLQVLDEQKRVRELRVEIEENREEFKRQQVI